MAVLEGGEPKVIPNAEGGRTTPSVAGFAKTGERLVGQVAKRQSVTNPENTVFSIKRFMGRRFDEVNDEMKMVPYKVVAAGRRAASRSRAKSSRRRNLRHDPHKLKRAAEAYLGERWIAPSSRCPPTSTTRSGRPRRTRADRGSQGQRLVNEPTAAALT